MAGSKIWYPQGFETDGVTRKFNYRIIENDVTFVNGFWSITNFLEQGVIIFGEGTSVIGQTSCRVGANITSGDVAPTTFVANCALWYDTKENYVKFTSDSGATWKHASFPLFEGRPVIGEGWTKGVEHIFNGFGYIGSTVFALPGVKGLIPNGRNADGSLKNIPFETSEVLLRILNESRVLKMHLLLNATYLGNSTIRSYDAEANYNYRTDTNEKLTTCFAGSLRRSTGGVITEFTPSKTVQVIDRNDGNFLSAQSMPSSRYIDLTLGASGTTYTAPANGWFSINGTDNGVLGTYNIVLRGTSPTSGRQFGVTTECNNRSAAWSACILPCKRGDTVNLYYSSNVTANSHIWRFYYAEGEI